MKLTVKSWPLKVGMMAEIKRDKIVNQIAEDLSIAVIKDLGIFSDGIDKITYNAVGYSSCDIELNIKGPFKCWGVRGYWVQEITSVDGTKVIRRTYVSDWGRWEPWRKIMIKAE